MSKRFTPEQLRFCENRVSNPNWSDGFCYLQAYPKCKSDNAAAVQACKLLKKAKITDKIAELVTKILGPAGAVNGRMLKEEACIAFFDPIDMVDSESGKFLEVSSMPDHARRALRGITITEDVLQGSEETAIRDGQVFAAEVIRRKIKYRFHDKGAALQRLERILGMFEKDNEQKPVEKTVERWVAVPSDRELTLAEWCEQVEELNRIQELKEKRDAGQDDENALGEFEGEKAAV